MESPKAPNWFQALLVWLIFGAYAFLTGAAAEQKRQQNAQRQAEKTVAEQQADAAARDHEEIQQEADEWRLPR